MCPLCEQHLQAITALLLLYVNLLDGLNGHGLMKRQPKYVHELKCLTLYKGQQITDNVKEQVAGFIKSNLKLPQELFC